jgi:hypothetical protein
MLQMRSQMRQQMRWATRCVLVLALGLGCSRGRTDAHTGGTVSARADESSSAQGALTDHEPGAGGAPAPGSVSPEASREARRMAEEEGESHHPLRAMSGDVLADYCNGCATRVCGIAYLDCAHNPECAERLRGHGSGSAQTDEKYRAACECIKKCANCAAKVSCR